MTDKELPQWRSRPLTVTPFFTRDVNFFQIPKQEQSDARRTQFVAQKRWKKCPFQMVLKWIVAVFLQTRITTSVVSKFVPWFVVHVKSVSPVRLYTEAQNHINALKKSSPGPLVQTDYRSREVSGLSVKNRHSPDHWRDKWKLSFDENVRFEFPEIYSDKVKSTFWNSEKEDNLTRYTEMFGNFLPEISVPFDFSHLRSGSMDLWTTAFCVSYFIWRHKTKTGIKCDEFLVPFQDGGRYTISVLVSQTGSFAGANTSASSDTIRTYKRENSWRNAKRRASSYNDKVWYFATAFRTFRTLEKRDPGKDNVLLLSRTRPVHTENIWACITRVNQPFQCYLNCKLIFTSRNQQKFALLINNNNPLFPSVFQQWYWLWGIFSLLQMRAFPTNISHWQITSLSYVGIDTNRKIEPEKSLVTYKWLFPKFQFMTEKFGKSKLLPQKLNIAQTNELIIAIFSDSWLYWRALRCYSTGS